MSHKTSQTTNTQGGRYGNFSSASSWNGMEPPYQDEAFLARRRNLKRFKKDFPEFTHLSNEKIIKVFKTYSNNTKNRRFKTNNTTLLSAGILVLFISRLALNLAFVRTGNINHGESQVDILQEESTLFNTLIAACASTLTTTIIDLY
mmetsp:Transcript_1888/g.2622  ORF Transcript_1888/g.2622 Transcript_1888/m.2622 type:complete len:147 (+) Transcript_1888:2977-3417(+)